jgi:uncharacterized RDD family membrane protein YckC
MEYGSYLRRAGALLLDMLFFVPAGALAALAGTTPTAFAATRGLACVLLWCLLNVFLVQRYGGSPGKLALGLRIVRADGTAVGYREALLRNSVVLLFLVLYFATLYLGFAQIPQAEWDGYPRGALGADSAGLRRGIELAPAWMQLLIILGRFWGLADFGTWVFNAKRRRQALHDFLAGTVVLRVRRTG